MDIIRVHTDAACDNNSKFRFMGLGVAVFINGVYNEDFSLSEMYGTNGTNNIAEWAGLELGLTQCRKLIEAYPKAKISIYMDSMLVVNQMNGSWKLKQEHLKDLFNSCRSLLRELQDSIVRIEWLPREENKEADILSKKAITDYLNLLEK